MKLDPHHKEAKDSIFYLKGRPLDVPVEAGASSIPGLDSDKALSSKDKLKFMLEEERGSSTKKDKRRRSKAGGNLKSTNLSFIKSPLLW